LLLLLFAASLSRKAPCKTSLASHTKKRQRKREDVGLSGID